MLRWQESYYKVPEDPRCAIFTVCNDSREQTAAEENFMKSSKDFEFLNQTTFSVNRWLFGQPKVQFHQREQGRWGGR